MSSAGLSHLPFTSSAPDLAAAALASILQAHGEGRLTWLSLHLACVRYQACIPFQQGAVAGCRAQSAAQAYGKSSSVSKRFSLPLKSQVTVLYIFHLVMLSYSRFPRLCSIIAAGALTMFVSLPVVAMANNCSVSNVQVKSIPKLLGRLSRVPCVFISQNSSRAL
jgi:hypothetical protein